MQLFFSVSFPIFFFSLKLAYNSIDTIMRYTMSREGWWENGGLSVWLSFFAGQGQQSVFKKVLWIKSPYS